MGRTRRQELIWLGLIVLCIALFVAHRTKQQPVGYDRQSMDELVKKSWQDPNADIVTGSIRPNPRSVADSYYVSFGNYGSIDAATRRYLDVVSRKPVLKKNTNVSIETLDGSEGVLHRVRMGEFETAWAARSTCLKAGFPNNECKVLPVR
jgi:hypothetical protein